MNSFDVQSHVDDFENFPLCSCIRMPDEALEAGIWCPVCQHIENKRIEELNQELQEVATEPYFVEGLDMRCHPF